MSNSTMAKIVSERLMMLAIVACLMVMAIGAAPAHASEPPRVFAGPFELRQSLYFHVVNTSGEAFSIALRWTDPQRDQMDRALLVRVFDPEEHLLTRHDALGEKGGSIDQSATLDVPARGPGVYQVAITGFTASIDFATRPPMSFGLFGYPELACRGDQFSDTWVYLPPGLEAMDVRGGEQMQSVMLNDESGQSRIDLTGASAGQAALPRQGAHVWRLAARAVANGIGTLNFGGMPVILCPDEASARATHASIDVLQDGTICFHKFQARVHELLQRYRAMPPSAFDVRPPVMVRDKADWLVEPVRNQLLLGPYGVFSGFDVVLSEQNLQSDSPWFGCIYCWRDDAGRARTMNPWTRCDRLGLSRAASTAATLAAVYSVRERFNRFAGDPALLNRIVIASLQELMMLREHELPLPEFTDYYGGERAFTFARFTLSFPLFIRDCPDDVRAVITDGFQHCVDHETISQVGNTVNQWSFIIRGLHQFSAGSDDPWYNQIVKRHLRWLLARNFNDWGFMPAGYFAESGPDSTYVGITLHNLGYVYEETHDPDLKDALRKCLDLFNHTVAPEPDGTWQCTTSFCTRTPDGWSVPQWGAGIGMLAGQFTEAAPLVSRAGWSLPSVTSAIALRDAERRTTDMLIYLDRQAFRNPSLGEAVLSDASSIAFLVWRRFAEAPLQGELPMVASSSFTRVFGDEFMCVRRPGYYTFIYAGKPMADWQKPQRPSDPHKQFPRNGGGLCLFWTPGFGSSLVAKNWSTYAAQTIIAERGDTAVWEDYWSVRSQFDAAGAKATITSTLLNQPVGIERRVQFFDDAVRLDLTLDVQAPPNATAVWECFPYPLDKPRPLSVRLLDEHGNSVQDRPASAICFDAGGTEAHVIVFAKPRRCSVGTDDSIVHYNKPRRHGRVLAEIPRALSVGQTQVRWMMLSTPISRVAQTISQSLQRLNADNPQ